MLSGLLDNQINNLVASFMFVCFFFTETKADFGALVDDYILYLPGNLLLTDNKISDC